jgi:hypothetical protein
MQRWHLTLAAVVLLTLVLVFFMGLGALLLVPFLWFLRRRVMRSEAEEPQLKATARFVTAGLAAVGTTVAASVAMQHVQVPQSLSMPLVDGAGISLFPASWLFIYWLEDTYALVPLDGMGRTILRTVVSLILASFAAIGFAIVVAFACAVAYGLSVLLLPRPLDFAIDSGWTQWGLLVAGLVIYSVIGFVLPFYATWKLLPQSARR